MAISLNNSFVVILFVAFLWLKWVTGMLHTKFPAHVVQMHGTSKMGTMLAQKLPNLHHFPPNSVSMFMKSDPNTSGLKMEVKPKNTHLLPAAKLDHFESEGIAQNSDEKLDHFESEGIVQNSDDKSPKEDVIKPSELDEQTLKQVLRGTLSEMQPSKPWKWEEPKQDEFVEFAARKIKNLKALLNAAEWRDIKWQGAHLAVAQCEMKRLLDAKGQLDQIYEALDTHKEMTPENALLDVNITMNDLQDLLFRLVRISSADAEGAMESKIKFVHDMIHKTDGTLVKRFQQNKRDEFHKKQEEADKVLDMIKHILKICNYFQKEE